MVVPGCGCRLFLSRILQKACSQKADRSHSRSPVRWSEIPVEGLDCKKKRGPARWPEIPVEGLDCETARPDPNWTGTGWRSPVRWPEIPVEGLDCETDQGPVRWPEIPVEGLACETERRAMCTRRGASFCFGPSGLWGRSRDALETLWDALGTFWGRSGDALGTLWERSGGALGTFWGHSEDAVGTLWDAPGFDFDFYFDFDLDFNFDFESRCVFHWIFMAVPLAVNWVLFHMAVAGVGVAAPLCPHPPKRLCCLAAGAEVELTCQALLISVSISI